MPETSTPPPPPAPPPSFTDLDRVYKETDMLYARLARGCGLSECAYWVMYSVLAQDEHPSRAATQRDIAERLSYTKQTLNSAVRSLAEKGLVVLSPAAGDRRSKEIRLTEDGLAFARERIAPAMRVEARAFAKLTAAEQEEFVRLATKYARAVHAEVEATGVPGRGGEVGA